MTTIKEEYLNNNSEEEFDFNSFKNKIVRRKNLFSIILSGFVFLSGIYAISQKRIWEGYFQIVVANDDAVANNILDKIPGGLKPFLKSGNSRKQILTEIKILGSPSVLNPVFEFYKNEKTKIDKNFNNKIRFNDWKNDNFNISLERGTTVLDITYQDNNKDLILPVITKISEDYQKYSGRDREIKNTNQLNYLSKQIEIYKDDLSLAEIKLENYENKYTLDPESFNRKYKSAIILNWLNKQLSIFENLKDDENIFNLENILLDQKGSIIAKLELDPNILKTLNKLNLEISRSRKIFRKSDTSIQELLIRREIILETLKNQVKSNIKTKISAEKEFQKITQKPPEVYQTYRNLLREALRKNDILKNLEDQYEILLLDNALKSTPWELISKPTLLDGPVAPNRKRIVMLGFLLGLIFAWIAISIADNKSGLLFEKKQVKNLIPYKLLKVLNINLIDSWENSIQIFYQNFLQNDPNVNLNLVIIGEPSSNNLENALNQFKLILNKNDKNIEVTNNSINSNIKASIILLAFSNKIKKEFLTNLMSDLEMSKNEIIGWIFIEE